MFSALVLVKIAYQCNQFMWLADWARQPFPKGYVYARWYTIDLKIFAVWAISNFILVVCVNHKNEIGNGQTAKNFQIYGIFHIYSFTVQLASCFTRWIFYNTCKWQYLSTLFTFACNYFANSYFPTVMQSHKFLNDVPTINEVMFLFLCTGYTPRVVRRDVTAKHTSLKLPVVDKKVHIMTLDPSWVCSCTKFSLSLILHVHGHGRGHWHVHVTFIVSHEYC